MESDAQAEDFDRLYRSTSRRVWAYCLRRTSETAAHDAVSEVYTVAWRRREQLPAEEHQALLWLLGVARNVLSNQARGRRRWARLLRRAAEQPVVAAEGDEGHDAVRTAMAALSPADQELLRLVYWDELPRADVAVVLGISPGAVSTRLHRARERVRARLDFAPPGPFETKILEKQHAER